MPVNSYFKIAAACFLVFVSSSSFASSIKPSDKVGALRDCEGETGYNNHEARDCREEELKIFEAQIKDALDVVYSMQSQQGPEADKEIKNRIRLAQESWVSYRNNHCEFSYYSKASTHPPSRSLAIITCKVIMTYNRVDEIKNTYRNL